jgi:hypothetical protein
MRRALPVLLAVPLLAGPAVLAFAKGGYFDGPRLWAGIGAWTLVAVVALTDGSPLPRAAPGRVAVGGLAVLTALTTASLLWAPIGGQAIDDVQRLLLYLGVLVAAVAVLRAPGPRRATEPALLAGIAVACVWALADRLGALDRAPVVSAGDRLAYPLTYWNASGAFAALGLVLAAGLAADADRPAALRTAAAATAPLLGLTLFLTLSRGAMGAAAAGFAVLLAVAPTAAQLRAVALAAAAAALPVAVAAVLDSTRTVSPTGRDAVAMTVVLVAATALAAATARNAGRPETRRLPRLRPAAVAALAVVLAGSVAAAVAADRGPTGTSQAAGRLASTQSNRYEYWRVAAGSFADHPLAGVGSGGFQVEWLRERRFEESVRDAHSLYLETAAELGVAGLVTLLLMLGGVVAAARRATAVEGAAAATAIAACAAWALHAGLDWDWEMPALTLVALVLAGRLCAAAEAPTPLPRSPAPPPG